MTNFPEMIAPQFNQKNVHRGEAHDEQQHTHYAPPSPHTALFFFSSSLSSFSTNLRASPLLLLLVRTNTQNKNIGATHTLHAPHFTTKKRRGTSGSLIIPPLYHHTSRLAGLALLCTYLDTASFPLLTPSPVSPPPPYPWIFATLPNIVISRGAPVSSSPSSVCGVKPKKIAST